MRRGTFTLVLALGCAGDTADTKDTGLATTDTADADADTDADSDSDADADSDADTDTQAEPSPFAGCTAVRESGFGDTTVYVYDDGGWLVTASIDLESDGTPEDTYTYTWTLVGGQPVELSWTSASGSSGTSTYDDWGHLVEASSTTASVTTTTTYANTLDADNRIVESVATTTGTDAVTTTDYNECELWISQEIDVDGDGSQIIASTNDWTLDTDCVPSLSVVTYYLYTVTTTYDEDGRELSSDYVDASGTTTTTWTWDCP